MSKQTDNKGKPGACMTRRTFLFGTGAAVAGTVLLPGLPGLEGKALAAEIARYPRKLIGQLSALKLNAPLKFNYPDEAQNSNSLLFRLDAPAGGGIGPDQNVVAFNALCTHMGGLLDGAGAFSAADQALGPCPLHQTSFDLTRHGIVIGGHATESLPQVLLELEGDDIYAVGMLGLIYGRFDNLKTG
ncbi:MAG: arsenate reductase (azurin) small subunit [Acidiferrobacteraceae bacterium]|jgi:arsenite oxidase small subunit|nr:arsenate reductase (azurin) small subunit [Acidiferrobacteraceae bacterium]MDP6397705.1 arsenate reductase (azurin) small subunit [Arenicellales bacterium]MDP6551155.1 arsenate reductase (azurin) small subunit [Arenicellales bacterium]MDP6918955.1 arsenate reductase (azurin) small subunit [Arenicellales bacterium]|tara:strand:+ start:21273 stop:21833 length:561 start_codon:yes stop_codon:yes gene_type:complete